MKAYSPVFPGLMSASMVVPAAVPSLTQSSSVPVAPGPDSAVVKKSLDPATVEEMIGGLTVPSPAAPVSGGTPNAFTTVVPAGVPSLSQRLGPCVASSAPKKSSDPTAVKFESR